MGASRRYRLERTRPVRSAAPLTICATVPAGRRGAAARRGRYIRTMADLAGSGDGGARPLASVPTVARPEPVRRQRVVRHPWRVVIVVGALLLVANLVVVLDQSADTSQGGKAPLPATVESISPERGALTTLH